MYTWNDVKNWFTIQNLKDATDAEGNPLPDGYAAVYDSDSIYACVGMKTRKDARLYAAAFMTGIHYLGSKF